MKVKVKKRPASSLAKQVENEFIRRWRKSSAETDKLLAALVKKRQEDMAALRLSAAEQVFVSDEFREWLSQHDPVLSEMIYKGFNVSEHRIDEAIRTYSSVSTPFLVHSLDGRHPN